MGSCFIVRDDGVPYEQEIALIAEDCKKELSKELKKKFFYRANYLNPDGIRIDFFTNEVDGHTVDLLINFELIPMPRCCAYLISGDTYINQEIRNKGLSKIINEAKYKIAKHSHHSYLLCTVRASNKVELHILERDGWEKIDDGIINKTTKHKIYMYRKKIN